MRYMQTFESFLNESQLSNSDKEMLKQIEKDLKSGKRTITVRGVNNIDHTRIVKWTYQYTDGGNNYSINKVGNNLDIDVSNLSAEEVFDIMNYLTSQSWDAEFM
jgi:hypothetical protein